MSPPPAAPLRRAPFTLVRPGRIPAGMFGPVPPRCRRTHGSDPPGRERGRHRQGAAAVAARCGTRYRRGCAARSGPRPVRDHSGDGAAAASRRPRPQRAGPAPPLGARAAVPRCPLPPPAAALVAPVLVPREPQPPALTCRCRCRCGPGSAAERAAAAAADHAPPRAAGTRAGARPHREGGRGARARLPPGRDPQGRAWGRVDPWRLAGVDSRGCVPRGADLPGRAFRRGARAGSRGPGHGGAAEGGCCQRDRQGCPERAAR